MIHQFENALSSSICQRLRDAHEKIYRFPVVYYPSFNVDTRNLLLAIILKTQQLVKETFLLESIYPETCILAKLGKDGYFSKHADNCKFDGTPNHTSNRYISTIYYLNSDFEGGEIVFAQHNLSIKPHEGLLLMYPSDHDHFHEVLSVKSGIRYTVPIWFTKDQRYSLIK